MISAIGLWLAKFAATAWLSKLKGLFVMLWQLICYLWRNWRITVPIIFVLAMVWYYQHELNVRDKRNLLTENKLAEKTHELQSLEWHLNEHFEEVQASNAKAEATAKERVNTATAEKEVALKQLNLANINRIAEQKKVSALNERINQSQIVAERTRANLNDSLRLAAIRENSRGGITASEEPSITEGMAASNSDLATLRDACRITTLDLIECHGIVEADTIACGREK
jgi:hypothetical protein